MFDSFLFKTSRKTPPPFVIRSIDCKVLFDLSVFDRTLVLFDSVCVCVYLFILKVTHLAFSPAFAYILRVRSTAGAAGVLGGGEGWVESPVGLCKTAEPADRRDFARCL